MQVRDLLHAQPTELTAADGAGHVIAAAVVHLDYVGGAAWARLDVVSCGRRLLAVADGRGAESPEAQALGSFLPGSIAGLVGVPNLLTVVAELSAAAFAPTG